jgi:hypothetical protein
VEAALRDRLQRDAMEGAAAATHSARTDDQLEASRTQLAATRGHLTSIRAELVDTVEQLAATQANADRAGDEAAALRVATERLQGKLTAAEAERETAVREAKAARAAEAEGVRLVALMRKTTQEEWETLLQDLQWTRGKLDEANEQVCSAWLHVVLFNPRALSPALPKSSWPVGCQRSRCPPPAPPARETLLYSLRSGLRGCGGGGGPVTQVHGLRPKGEERGRVQKQLNAALERMAALQGTVERMTDRAKRKDREVGEYKVKAVEAIRSKEVAESKQAILQVCVCLLTRSMATRVSSSHGLVVQSQFRSKA